MTTEWEQDALCREVGSAIFFPDAGAEDIHFRYDDAREICHACPVRAQCLDAAMDREGSADHQYRGGMWGGLSPVERERLHRSGRESVAA